MSDVSLSVSEAAFETIYNRIVPTPSLPFSKTVSFAGLAFGVDGALHVAGAGDIDFEDGDSFWLDELKIGWDQLVLRLGFDIPAVTVGRFCILRVQLPWESGDDCKWEFPGGQLFGADMDIGPLTINLNAIIPYVVTEVSGRFSIGLVSEGDTLKLKVYKQSVDVDPISIQDTFGKLPALLQAALAAAAASFVAAHPPMFLVDAALGILGFPTVTELLLDVLDIGDDVQEWLTRRLNVDIGIQNILAGLIAKAILEKTMFDIPDPYGLLPSIDIDVADFGGFADPQPAVPQTTLDAPRANIVDPDARFDADTLHIRFDLGL
ncbi:hypothetical protein ACFFTM_08525 [Pseudoduganella plicata]|uniref:DUF4403 family protein n=1 Tax=Pseudoduganella plicata TaxID=321984 RepID=A0A4P7BBF7_9BURK|nr:hypothetical protein [Pseudoduganella plicata]QBQ35470.1 hypothetical protein E1742_04290 [Pseudoduganella plicata]GGZ02034.1 hypothetical protein GCM10007388_39740 [Pseudoduganella plicata]